MNWKIGQKLVCIDNGFQLEHPIVIKGEIYTFDGLSTEWQGYIRLKEMPGMCYRSKLFRPIVDIGDEVEQYIKSKITETEYA